MRLPFLVVAVLVLSGPLASSVLARKAEQIGTSPVPTSSWSDLVTRYQWEPGMLEPVPIQAASAVANTLVLASYKFDTGFNCATQGWTTTDLTQQTGDYWHVDDFAPSNSLGSLAGGASTGGIVFTPVQGSKSMWMGKRIPPPGPVDPVHCGYLALPGYGNGWNQSFCSKDCLSVAGGATPQLDIAFKIKFDSEASYDATSLEYTTDCAGNAGWYEIDGGNPLWTGADSFTVAGQYNVVNNLVRVRLRFSADTTWSNQDGFYPGFGVAIDSLSWENKPVEDFESEGIGAHASEDWQSCITPGFGNYLALFKSDAANYEDLCLDNIGCYWAAIQGSTEFYTCGTPPQPTQRIVPHMNARGEYLANEIWSPAIPFTGSGSEFRLRYTVYRDLPLDNLIFHVWHVRTIDTSGCPSAWKDRGFVYYGATKDWAIVDNSVGAMLDLNTGVSLQLAIGVVDLCRKWCGVFGTGVCHSPAPYIDQIQLRRVDVVGPQWDVRAIDTLQDTFATNGTLTGTARADAAIDIKPTSSPTFTPGDSAVALFLVDPKYAGPATDSSGLLNDPNISTFIGRHKTKKQAYVYVAVWPRNQPGKTGAPLSEGPGGQANRYPFSGTVVVNGVTWTKIRMDYTYTGTATNFGDGTSSPFDPYIANRFNVDLNDNLFTPGDTVFYFFGATSADGTRYFSTEYGATADINEIAANAMEFTIFPAGGYRRGGNLLYVDGADGQNNDVYFYGGFWVLGLNDKIDRYDVRAPSSAASNRLGGRVTNVANQLNACYQTILWDTGSLAVTLGDGSGDPEKCDDYALLNTFLGNLTGYGGVFLCGDKVAEYLDGYAGASAVTFRSLYFPFTLINDNHRLLFGVGNPASPSISPKVIAWPGRCFNDNFFVFGGCPELNDFDVIGASGASRVEMSYNTAMSANGAVVSHVNGPARVIVAGFSLALLRDWDAGFPNELDGIFDRAKFMRDILFWMGHALPATSVTPEHGDALAQNYPNPFNPQTTIAFSLKARGHVELSVYDVAGRLVRTLANETRATGANQVTWDGRDGNGSPVASGVYFYRLVAPEFSQTKKMVLLK